MTEPEKSTADPTTDKPPMRKRWFPLSLRIFLGFLGGLLLAAVWVGVRAYRHDAAITSLDLST